MPVMNIHGLYHPFSTYFRRRRMARFAAEFGVTRDTRVLDIGGSSFNWALLAGTDHPRLTILNLAIWESERDRNVTLLVADGRHLPFKDGAFDIAYSNSVIEHLSDLESQRLFASEIRRVGRRYYVQTPNRRFPVEPHLITPFIHWLPRPLQRRLLRNFTVWGWITRPSREECDSLLRELRLLDEKEARELFPDAQVWKERLLGLTKSLIVVRVAMDEPSATSAESRQT